MKTPISSTLFSSSKRFFNPPASQAHKSLSSCLTTSPIPSSSRSVHTSLPTILNSATRPYFNRQRMQTRSTMTTTMSVSSSSASPDITYQPTAVSTGHRHGDGSPLVHCFFDNPTSTWTYLVVDPTTKDALVIDPVLEFDPASGSIGTESVQGLAAFIAGQGYKVTRIIETHIHADHATGARALKSVSTSRSPDRCLVAKCLAEELTDIAITNLTSHLYWRRCQQGPRDICANIRYPQRRFRRELRRTFT